MEGERGQSVYASVRKPAGLSRLPDPYLSKHPDFQPSTKGGDMLGAWQQTLREVSTMTRTITSAVAFSVYVSFLIWMSVLATQTDVARYSIGPKIFQLHNPQLNEGDPESTLH